ncbi:MAG: RNA pseudouridine synthase [Porphyromonas sp.]|nr:RNA pseudouridine synthase [Porphyromonas sp.]
MQVVYEDNHLIVVCKAVGEIVQGDKTGDLPLVDSVKAYLKEKYHKTGNVFAGLVHRLDRPVAGLVVFAKTSKALSRMNKMLKEGRMRKTYLAIVESKPAAPQARLIAFLYKNEQQNKSYVVSPNRAGAKKAILSYRLVGSGDRYQLLEVNLETGRHHQIRCQLAHMGCVIRGDLKYGAKRSNHDGGISLLAYRLYFEHPVSHTMLDLVVPMGCVDPLFATLLQCSRSM